MPINKDHIRGILCEIPNSVAQRLCVLFPTQYVLDKPIETLERRLDDMRGAFPNNRFWFLVTDQPLSHEIYADESGQERLL